MTWLRVDDQIAFAIATVMAGNAAMGAWLRLSAWSSAQLSDGAVPRAVACTMASQPEIDALAGAGLLSQHGDAYEIVGFLDTNPSRVEVLAKREASRAGGRLGASRRWSPGDGSPHGTPNGSTHESPHGPTHGGTHPSLHAPVPARPVQTPTGEGESTNGPSPLTLTGETTPKTRKKEPKHPPELVALKARVLDAFCETVKAKKGIDAKVAHPGEHAAAFQLAKVYGEEAIAIVRRALEDPFVLGSNCTLRYVASKGDTWRGTAPKTTNGRHPPVQPSAPPGERAFAVGRAPRGGWSKQAPGPGDTATLDEHLANLEEHAKSVATGGANGT